jgi:MSHA pilin protein MshC
MPTSVTKHLRGFTFLEIIVVLALISILSLVVLARQRTSNTGLPARAQILKAHLRFAQSRAMNNDTFWGIEVTGDGTRYRLFNNEDDTINRMLPGEDGGMVDLDAFGLAVGEGDITVAFDTWGRPCSDTAGTTPYDSNQTLTLGDTEGNTNSITITKNTGYIP